MQKGQLFSLDFLVSLIVVMLAIGLVFQFSELQTYDLKDKMLFDETKRVAETASNMLVGNPAILCKLVEEGTANQISYLSNCIDSSNPSALTKNNLGIPAAYNCNADGITITDCSSIPTSAAKNSYSVKRTILLHSGNLSKKDYDNCINLPSGTCTAFTEKEVTLTIWK